MRTFTVSMMRLRGIGSVEGAEVSAGIEVASRQRGERPGLQLGQYDRDGKLAIATLDRENPAEIRDRKIFAAYIYVPRSCQSGPQIMFVRRPAHQYDEIIVRINTKTERSLGLSLGDTEEDVEVLGGGYGHSGPRHEKWDDVLVKIPPFKTVGIKNCHTAFVITNNAGEAGLFTTDEYVHNIVPHRQAQATDATDEELETLARGVNGRNSGTRLIHKAALVNQ